MTKDSNSKPAVFIDRDGTLIEEVNFLSKVEDLRIFPYTPAALARLRDNDYRVVVITNQSGIGRKIFSESEMQAIHDEIERRMPDAVDAFYYCPHLPGDGCRCRKPNLGLVEEACSRFGIDMSRSWFIGDKMVDVETGFNAGIKTAMVLTGYGAEHSRQLEKQPNLIVENLLEAAEQIVKY